MAVVVPAAAGSASAGACRRCAQRGGAWQKLRLLWVDGGYREQRVAWVRHQRRFVLRVTLRPGATGFVLLPRRWVVDRVMPDQVLGRPMVEVAAQYAHKASRRTTVSVGA